MVEYTVKRTGGPGEAVIFLNDREVAKLSKEDDQVTLISRDGERWNISRRVEGELRPFSMQVKHGEKSVLTIKDNLFKHKGKFYLFMGIPEGKPMREILLGRRFICRLDNFPFNEHHEIDHETRSRIRRFRGPAVGELDGLGKAGHKVKLEDELKDIGLQISACSYLIYSAG
ncbi:MAG: hypothetical protein QXT39_03670 [Conexivisphaerales archaeon]